MCPLTLLNNDYKILAKLLDNRLRETLPSIIQCDQTGFIRGRKISHNVRKSLDVIDYVNKHKMPGLILSIDMEKCFDRLEYTAIFESLRYFNFGEHFIRWIQLFYTNFQICTQNFGILSHFWEKGRGCQQGCPLSPGLYLLTAEILANKLRNNSKIKGIQIGEIEYLISQFADDTDLYLTYDQETISETFKLLSGIETNTGLRVSYEKTTMYRIGTLANSNAKMYTPRKVSWSNDYINTLGVDLYNNPTDREANMYKVLNKMKTISNIWYYRQMTLSGKVLIVNSLMASLYVYKMQVMPIISNNMINEIEAEIINFLWKGKRPKIPLTTLQCSKKEGGLGLVNIRIKHESLLCSWINDCKDNKQIGNLAKAFLGNVVDGNQIWEFNLRRCDSEQMFPGDSFLALSGTYVA